MISGIANSLWLAGCLPDAVLFRRAVGRVRDTQAGVLRQLLRANADTEFGQLHRFSTIRSAREYQDRVPLLTYDDYRAHVERLAGGGQNVLTREPVRLFEPTSGSSDAVKLIPYTASLRREFQRAIRPWIANLFLQRPELMEGQAYWSVSPPTTRAHATPAGIPIGFDDDSSYVGGWHQRLVQQVMAVPASIRHESDIETFQFMTLRALVGCRSLRIVSVWHPTFLMWLVGRLEQWGDRLAADLPAGRRRALVCALGAATSERHRILWPRLGLISCWADANATWAASRLSALFPQAQVQGKGLIATEGVVSFPLLDRQGAVLAVRSHFLEFASPEDPAERPRLAHELELGRRYAVIITTGGGLYRYQLQDVIEVVGVVEQCSLVRFVGRTGHAADWFGEKLTDAYVSGVLAQSATRTGVVPAFAMLACDDTLPEPAYVLYVESAASDQSLDRLGREVESALHQSFHYNHARRLGQLGPLRVFRAEAAGGAFLDRSIRFGQRAGDVKPPAVDSRSGWSQVFRGRFIAAS